jgi:hypothetical protein
MSQHVAEQPHFISTSYADFHQTAAVPRDMERNMKPTTAWKARAPESRLEG